MTEQKDKREALKAQLPATLEILEWLKRHVKRPEGKNGLVKYWPRVSEAIEGSIDELYESLFGEEERAQQIDEELGAGTAAQLATEQQQLDGGLFQPGGLTGGGIFGDAPIPTNVHDPGARLRGAALGGHVPDEALELEAAKGVGAQLTGEEKRRRRLLKGENDG